MSEYDSNAALSLTQEQAFHQFLDLWVKQSAPALVEVARRAAIPHTFALSLSNHLLDQETTDEELTALLGKLERAGFLASAGEGRYALRQAVRGYFLQRWQQEAVAAYRALNRRAAEFYQSQPPSEERDAELLYHELGAEDERGIALLDAALSEAWAARQTGRAERLLRYASEQAPGLGLAARAQFRLHQARLDGALGRAAEAEAALRELTQPEVPDALRAEATLELAETLVATQQWAEAIRLAGEAAKHFAAQGDALRVARALEAQAMAYLDLATNLGGLPGTVEVGETGWARAWRRFEHAPFLLYRWFSRRLTFLPNLYFGTDYQDWIITRLLLQATRRLGRAERQLATLGTEPPPAVAILRADIGIRLADLHHCVGRWALAEQRMAALATNPSVTGDPYRRATLHVVEGRAALARSRCEAARQHLEAARDTFYRYSDPRALATALSLLGETEVAARQPEAAVLRYLETVQATLAVNDLLGATHAWATLLALRERAPLPPASVAEIDALDQSLDRRAFIARFPGTLLRHFRRLASLVVLPLTYLVVLIGAYQVADLINGLETLFRGIPRPTVPLLSLGLNVILLGTLPVLTLWLYELFYLIAGWLYVFWLPLDHVTERQPQYVVTVPAGILLRDEHGLSDEMAWNEVERVVAVDRSLWRAPLALFSQTVLGTGQKTWLIHGIVSHYALLQREITQRLARADSRATLRSLSYSLFASRWALLAGGLALLATAAAIFNWLSPDKSSRIATVFLSDGSAYRLPLATVLREMNVWLPRFLPLVGLVGLLVNRWRVRRSLGDALPWGAGWLLWLALLLLLFLTLGELWALTL